jgi:hypothetical protein
MDYMNGNQKNHKVALGLFVDREWIVYEYESYTKEFQEVLEIVVQDGFKYKLFYL